MNHPITRMISILLTFGIFFSLASCNNLEKTTSGQPEDEAQTLQNEINEIDSRISKDPVNADLQAEKANLLYRYSQTIPHPENRHPIYQNIRDIADSFFNGNKDEGDAERNLNDLLVEAWSSEQRNGIKLLQQDQSERTDEQLSRIISHFENAITLIPDSLRTYSLLATTHYQHGNLNEAVRILEQADDRSKTETPEFREKLAYLYLEAGELNKAEARYYKLVEDYPDNLFYKHGLVNVLILSEKHQEATELLKELSEEYPSRPAYQESLATELYYIFEDKTDQYIQNRTDRVISEREQQELTALLDNIHSLSESIHEKLPATEENLFRMATLYKNASMRLKEIPVSKDEDSFSALQRQFMEYSLPLWEQLAELSPDNPSHINNLYQVYLELEMEEDAEAIERSYKF